MALIFMIRLFRPTIRITMEFEVSFELLNDTRYFSFWLRISLYNRLIFRHPRKHITIMTSRPAVKCSPDQVFEYYRSFQNTQA